jgi:hypothetical protein
MTEPFIRFSDLCDLLTAAGCTVGVELSGTQHAIVVTAGGGRVLRARVEQDFDRTATVLVLSGALRQRWGARDVDHDGWAIRGEWPELETLAFERSA